MNATIAGLALRAVVGKRRVWLMAVLPTMLVILALVIRSLGGDEANTDLLLTKFGLPTVLPLVALLVTSATISTEIDDGSIAYLLAKPVPRLTVITSKYAVALGGTVVFGVLPLALAGLVLSPSTPEVAAGFLVAGAAAALAYCALFLALCAAFKHAVMWGLAYVLLWESGLGSNLGNVKWVSITAWANTVVDSMVDVASVAHTTPLAYAIGAVVVVTVGCVFLAGDRLRSFTLTGI